MLSRRSSFAIYVVTGWRKSVATFAASLLAATLGAFGLVATLHAKPVALLVGVADYAGTTRSLHGPANDVAALAERLVKHWGFADADIVRLVNAQATRGAILRELAALQSRSAPGDTVFIYLSGHGVSMYASDADGGRNSFMPDSSGGAFVAVDSMRRFNAQQKPNILYEDLLVGRRDIRPIVELLDRSGRMVTLIADTCYSGNLLRSSSPLLAARLLPTLGEDVRDLLRDLAARDASTDASPKNIYRNAHILTSAAAGETAADIPAAALSVFPTVDGKPHGAMTDALLRILDGSLPADIDGDGVVSFAEVHRTVTEFMDARSYGHTPQRIPSVAETATAAGRFLNQGTGALTQRPKWPAVRPLSVFVDTAADGHTADLVNRTGLSRASDPKRADLALYVRRGEFHLDNSAGSTVAKSAVQDSSAIKAALSQASYVERLHSIANAGQRAMLEFEIDPPVFGGNLTIGQSFVLVVKPDRKAHLLVVAVDANGRVTTLYPQSVREQQPLAAGERRVIPGPGPQDRIEVSPPVGTDYLFALAFDDLPAEYDKVSKIDKFDVFDPAVSRIEQLVRQANGKYTYGRAVLRTFPAPAKKPS